MKPHEPVADPGCITPRFGCCKTKVRRQSIALQNRKACSCIVHAEHAVSEVSKAIGDSSVLERTKIDFGHLQWPCSLLSCLIRSKDLLSSSLDRISFVDRSLFSGAVLFPVIDLRGGLAGK